MYNILDDEIIKKDLENSTDKNRLRMERAEGKENDFRNAEVRVYIKKRLEKLGCDKTKMHLYKAMITYLTEVRERVKKNYTEGDFTDFIDEMISDFPKARTYNADVISCALQFIQADICEISYEDDNKAHELFCCMGKIYRTLEVDDGKERCEELSEIRYPKDYKTYMDQYVIGQEQAKKAVATAVYFHQIREKYPDTVFTNNVLLLAGPTGCGKSEIMRCVERITDFPMIYTDVSSLGDAQHTGRHMEDILLSLWEASGKNMEKAEHGILFMDEFDKLLPPMYSNSGTNKSDMVQSQLLTILEGRKVELYINDDTNRMVEMDTSNILFVLAGAFDGIEEYIKGNEKKKQKAGGNIGFNGVLKSEIKNEMDVNSLTLEVLKKYGMKRELAGRIGNIAVLNGLSEESMMRILTEPKDSMLECYRKEVKLMCGAELRISKEVLQDIAKKAAADKIGARALFPLLRKVMRPILYNAGKYKHVNVISVESGEDGKWEYFTSAF